MNARPVAALALSLALAGCSSGLKRPVQEITAAPDAHGVQRVRVVAHSYWFAPNRIVLKAGAPVELTVHNAAFLVPHNLTCNAADAGIEVSASLGLFHGTKVERFTPTKPGEYEFFCHVGSHAKHGMKGTFVVVE
jgi:plastocyanin